MFSEYASKFLAQSQSRLSIRQPEEPQRNPLDRRRYQDQNASRHGGSRYLPLPGLGASNLSQFPFSSRANNQAPLFHSAVGDDFPEQEEDYAQEVADFFAQQRSRRQFMPSKPLEESSEVEDDGSRASGTLEAEDGRDLDDRGNGPQGIRSSWIGDRNRDKIHNSRAPMESVDEHNLRRIESGSSNDMEDVGLESRLLDDSNPPAHLTREDSDDDEPPSVQYLKKAPPKPMSPYTDFSTREPLAEVPESETETSAAPPSMDDPDMVRHDVFWGHLYLIAFTSVFATYLLVYLHTSVPQKKPLGDTIYSTVHASFHLLAVDTVVAVIVSLLWLTALRSYAKPLIYAIVVAVPVILTAFTLYPFISSFQHTTGKDGYVQDTVMRWFSGLPLLMTVLWLYGVFKNRHAFSKAVGILEFACKILAANPPLLMVGFGVLAGVVIWTWVWVIMFSRVFLSGKLSGMYFIIDLSAWWLGAFFILVYLWTLNVGMGIQRATTAATVSMWYFHRHEVNPPTTSQVISASLKHSLTTVFGTICLSTLTSLLLRLPVYLMPGRLMACATFLSYKLLPESVLIMTHPTTLTYASIHTRSLVDSAKGVASLAVLPSAHQFPARARRTFIKHASNQPYNLAGYLLHATRLIASFAFGFGAWVNTARKLEIQQTGGLRGSVYAYIVGLMACAIGYGIIGAMEGVLTGIVDAVVVCWASEMRGGGQARYCREAGYLLGGDDGFARDEEEGFLR